MAKKTGILNQNKTSENILDIKVKSELPIENDLEIKLTTENGLEKKIKSESSPEEIKLKSSVHGDIDEENDDLETTEDTEEPVVETPEILKIQNTVSHRIDGEANLSKDAIRFYLRTGIKI